VSGTSVQGAYIGVTTGLVVTFWLGLGALIYKPAIRGRVPPPLDTSQCPHRNVTVNVTALPSPSTTSWPESTSADSLAPIIGAEDM